MKRIKRLKIQNPKWLKELPHPTWATVRRPKGLSWETNFKWGRKNTIALFWRFRGAWTTGTICFLLDGNVVGVFYYRKNFTGMPKERDEEIWGRKSGQIHYTQKGQILSTEIPQDPVAEKPSKREEQDDDNHCHSPRRPWVQGLPAWRRKWLSHFFVAMIYIKISYNCLVKKYQTCRGSSWTPFSAPWACWRRTSTGSPASPPSTRGSSLRSNHSQDHIVIYIARGHHTYLAWQGSVLYEDGARLSEVGIMDGCSVHLAIYSTDQVCRGSTRHSITFTDTSRSICVFQGSYREI